MATGTGAGHADFGEYAERKFYFRELRYCEVRRMDLPRTRIRNTGKRKAGPPWSGEYRLARLNEIVTRCNALINLCICCKWAFSSQRVCALIPAWRAMVDPPVASPIIDKGQRRPGIAAWERSKAKGRSVLVNSSPLPLFPRGGASIIAA